MQMSDCCVVVTTVADEDAARALARTLVDERLAACVQWFAVESLYRWEGVVENAREFRLQAKTRADRVSALQECIRERHAYATPEIVVLPVAGGDSRYLDWVRAECAPA